MAAHEPMPVEEIEYEYVVPRILPARAHLTSTSRYEALPPNTSLLANLAAGAFAGIMVRFPAWRDLSMFFGRWMLILYDRSTRSCIRLMLLRLEGKSRAMDGLLTFFPRLACKW